MPRSILAALVLILLASSCGDGPSDQPRWYYTCGDPVCRGYSAPPGVAACASGQSEGAACSAEGTRCDPVDSCNRLLQCATRDPRQQPGGCPVSHASAKQDIRYLSAADLEARYAELRALRLATYRYRDALPGSAERLGFLLDDGPPAACVRGDGETVDLYGYNSLTVAAVQAQARRIDALERQLQALQSQLAAGAACPPVR